MFPPIDPPPSPPAKVMNWPTASSTDLLSFSTFTNGLSPDLKMCRKYFNSIHIRTSWSRSTKFKDTPMHTV